MLLQIPEAKSESANLLIIVDSFTAGLYTKRSMSELGRFKPVAHEPNTMTTASGYYCLTTYLIFLTKLSRYSFFNGDG